VNHYTSRNGLFAHQVANLTHYNASFPLGLRTGEMFAGFLNKRDGDIPAWQKRSRNVARNPALDLSLFRAAAHFRNLEFWDGAPKFGLGRNKFDGNLRLAHQGWAQTGDSAKHFLSYTYALQANNLLGGHGSREKDQRSMGIHDYGVSLFRDGIFVGVLESSNDRGLVQDTLAAPAIAHF
jgi:hypothetical protein